MTAKIDDQIFPEPLRPYGESGPGEVAVSGHHRQWCDLKGNVEDEDHGVACMSGFMGAVIDAADKDGREFVSVELRAPFVFGVYEAPLPEWIHRTYVTLRIGEDEEALHFRPHWARSLGAALVQAADVAEGIK